MRVEHDLSKPIQSRFPDGKEKKWKRKMWLSATGGPVRVGGKTWQTVQLLWEVYIFISTKELVRTSRLFFIFISLLIPKYAWSYQERMLCKTCITFLCGKLTHHQKTSWLKLRSSCKMQVREFQDGVRKILILILITGVWMKQAGALMSQTQSRTEFYFLALIDNLKMLLDTLTNHLAWVAATINYLLQPPTVAVHRHL